MFKWLDTDGAEFKSHVPGQMNYVRSKRAIEEDMRPRKPFPANFNFFSEPILSEELRNEVYEQVVKKKKSVRAVSVEYGIDMRRVGAVVRLVELEKRSRAQVNISHSLDCFASLHNPRCNDETQQKFD